MAHRYWRLHITAANNVNSLTAKEIQMRDVSGGTDLTGSGTASASSNYSGYPASNAFDDNNSTFWRSAYPVPSINNIIYDFGAGNDVEIIELTYRPYNDTTSPYQWDFQFSDDNSVWTTRASFTTPTTGWDGNVDRVFDTSPSYVEKTLELKWRVLTYATKSIEFDWKIAFQDVSKTIAFQWNDAFQDVTKTAEFEWNVVYQNVSKSIAFRWNDLAYVTKSNEFKWNVANHAVSGHRYWRIKFNDTQAQDFASIGELQLFDEIGGVNVVQSFGAYASPSGDSSGWGGLTGRTVIPASDISQSFSQTTVKIAFQGANGDASTITEAYIGLAAETGDDYDFASTPTQIKFNGGNNGCELASNEVVTSDDVSFSYINGRDVVISFYVSTTATGTHVPYSNGSGWKGRYKNSGAVSDAATVNATGYSSGGIGANSGYLVKSFIFFQASGEPSASSEYSASYAATAAFDNDPDTDWSSNSGEYNTGWLQWDFGVGNSRDIVQLKITAATGSDTDDTATDFDLQYSDDGASFTTLQNFTTGNWTAAETRTFTVAQATVDKSIAFIWNVFAYVAKTVEFKWNLNVEKALSFKWNIENEVSKSISFDWNILYQPVSKSLELEWNVAVYVFKTVEFKWNDLAYISKTIELEWDILATAPIDKTLVLKYNVAQANNVTASLLMVWHDEFAIAEKSTEFKWDNATTYALKTLALRWNIAQSLRSVAVIPETPITENWEWLTSLFKARSGDEQRKAWRKVPRVRVEYNTLILSDAERADFLQTLFDNAGKPYVMPFYAYGVPTAATATAGATAFSCDTTISDFRAGEYVALYDPAAGTLDSYPIASIAAGTVTLDSGYSLARGYPAGTYAIPAREMRLSDASGPEMAAVSGSIRLVGETISVRPSFTRPGASVSLTMLDGFPVLTRQASAEQTSPEKLEAKYTVIDNDVSSPTIYPVRSRSDKITDRFFVVQRLFDPGDFDYWRAFFAAIVGSLKPFLMPTFFSDLLLAETPTNGATTITVKGSHYAYSYFPFPTYRYLQLTRANGVQYVKVTAATVTGGNSVLTLADALENTAITKISFVNLVRLEDDTVTLTHRETTTELEFQTRTIDA